MTRVWLSVLAAIVVLTAIWWFAFYSPASEQQTALEEETASLDTRAAQLTTQLAQLEDIRAREVEIRADLARLESFIPTNPSQATLVRQAQLSADASGVTIQALTFADPTPVGTAPLPAQPGLVLGAIETQMQVTGGYFQVVDYLRRLEVEVARAIYVDGIQLEEGDDGFPQLSGVIDATIFALITAPVDPNAQPAIPDEAVTEGPEAADGEVEAGEGAEDEGEQLSQAGPALTTEGSTR